MSAFMGYHRDFQAKSGPDPSLHFDLCCARGVKVAENWAIGVSDLR